MRHKGFTLIEMFAVVGSIVLLALIFYPVYKSHQRPTGVRSVCQTNLKEIGRAFKQYNQDNDERMPRIALNGAHFGWADALEPYLKSTQIFQCPQETRTTASTTPSVAGYTDYWMNWRASGFLESNFSSSADTVLSGDGNDGRDITDARYAKWAIPTAWFTATSPASRHLNGFNFLFVDGHVKWFKSAKSNFPVVSRLGPQWKP